VKYTEDQIHKAKLELCKLVDGSLWMTMQQTVASSLAEKMLTAPSSSERESIHAQYMALVAAFDTFTEIANSVRGENLNG
jgi:hypothetical protein